MQGIVTESPLRTLRRLIGSHEVKVSRRGMPHPILVRGWIVGFVEIRRSVGNKKKRIFHKLCERHSIPYEIWWPGKSAPIFIQEAIDKRR